VTAEIGARAPAPPPPPGPGVHALAGAAAIARLRAGRPTVLATRGGSMRPFFREGMRVLVEPCPPGRLRPGAVAAFERDGQVILHRVLGTARARAAIVEKGDHQPRPGLVEGSKVLGRVVEVRSPVAATLLRGRPAALAPWIARAGRLQAYVHGLLGGAPRGGPGRRRGRRRTWLGRLARRSLLGLVDRLAWMASRAARPRGVARALEPTEAAGGPRWTGSSRRP
jgi:hypothetical protein